MIDYKLKSEVLNSDYCSIQRKVSKILFKYRYNSHPLNYLDRVSDDVEYIETLQLNSEVEEAYKLLDNYRELNPIYWKESEKINHATYQRNKRLKLWIQRMLDYPCVFITLTFNEQSLSDLDEYQRRQKVCKYLKSQSNCYVANIDFGADIGREHYHAVVLTDFLNLDAWKLGFPFAEKINVSDSDALSKYISKLTNHAIKETTRRNHVIYSRISPDKYGDLRGHTVI